MTDPSQSGQTTWKPGLDTAILDKHMANAMKRAVGAAGAAVTFERGIVRLQNDAAVRQLAGTLHHEVIAQRMLTAFYEGAGAAFAEARETLDLKASLALARHGVDGEERLAVLAGAGAGFAAPSAEALAEVGRAHACGMIPPVTQGAMGAAGGFALVAAVGGVSVAALCAAPMFGIFAYFSAKGRARRLAEELVTGLPRGAYSLLVSKWNAGLARYADEISAHIVHEEIEAAVLSV